MEVKKKCNQCNMFKDFVSYDDRVSFAIHKICYDDKHNHYDKIPFLTRTGRLNISERDKKMRSWIKVYFIFSTLLILTMCLFELWLASFLILAFFLMWEYVLIQLHLDDISSIRVFELAFNNETKQNLLSIGVANNKNRTFELFKKPSYEQISIPPYDNSISGFLKRITFVRFFIALYVLTHKYIVRYKNIGNYLLRIPAMSEGVNLDIYQVKEVVDEIISQRDELESINLRIIGIEYIDKLLPNEDYKSI